MSNIAVIGVDPGLSGAVAILHPSGDIELFDTPTLNVQGPKKNRRLYDVTAMLRILQHCKDACFKYSPPHVAIEMAHPRPGQGVNAPFSMGYGLGLWIGIITSMELPVTHVAPQTWKKEFQLSKDKNLSILRAKELWPKADITLKKHEARAEALMIADYLRRRL